MPAHRLYTVAEVAELLGTSRTYVYERIRAKEFRIVDLGTSVRAKTRIRADDLQAFIDTRTSSGPRK